MFAHINPADLLRERLPECPNCHDEMVESVHADGLHLTCEWCGFFATEEWAKRMLEKFDAND